MGEQKKEIIDNLIFKRVCFAPSEYFGNLPESRIFGQKIAEPPIIMDYLKETGVLSLENVSKSLKSLAPLLQNDWWDKVDKEDYVDMLTKRHSHLKKEVLMKDKFQWPDISTYKGQKPRKLPSGAINWEKGDRNEYYEIKPNSESGRKAGQEKLENIKKMYEKYRLDKIYRPGNFYPQQKRKKIKLLSKFYLNLNYLLGLKLQNMGVDIYEIWLEVDREAAGMLLYKFCVSFKLRKRDEKLANYVAAEILTKFIRTTTINLDSETIRTIMVAASKLEIVEIDENPIKQPQPISAIINVFDVPMLKLKWGSIAGELEHDMESIRNTMYSRLMGKPGEQYFLCCDKNYYQQVYFIPSRRIVEANADKERVRYFISPPLFGPKSNEVLSFRGTNLSLKEMKDLDAMYARNTQTLVFMAVSLIFLSALAVTTIVVAAPAIAAALTPTAPVVIASGTTATTATITVVESTVTVGSGTAAIASAPPIAATPGLVTALRGAATAANDVLPAVIPAAAASIMLVVFTPSEAKAAAVPDDVFDGNIGAVPKNLALLTGNHAWLARVCAEKGVKKAIEEAVSAGDVGLIGLSAAPIYERESVSNPGNLVGMPSIGRLYLVKVKKDKIDKAPEMYTDFKVNDYAEEKQSFDRMYFLGKFSVE